MTLPQHLVPTLADAGAGGTVVLEGDEAHHAVVVRRMRVGEQLQLTDGRGRVAHGVVAATSKRALEVEVTDLVDHPAPLPRIDVAQALPKGDRGELAVEVLTEIGVARILPWAAERSVAVWKGERAARSRAKWASAAREAAKQSRRAWHPEVAQLVSTEGLVAVVADVVAAAGLAVVLHEADGVPLDGLTVPASGTVLLVVGPEGGLTDAEVERLVGAGAVAVRMGSEVLRTSTAGVAAAAALLSRTARWGADRAD